jgi:hypothetical protein
MNTIFTADSYNTLNEYCEQVIAPVNTTAWYNTVNAIEATMRVVAVKDYEIEVDLQSYDVVVEDTTFTFQWYVMLSNYEIELYLYVEGEEQYHKSVLNHEFYSTARDLIRETTLVLLI